MQPPFLPPLAHATVNRRAWLLSLLRYYGPAAVVLITFVAGVVYILQDPGDAGRTVEADMGSLWTATTGVGEAVPAGEQQPVIRENAYEEILLLSTLSYPPGATVTVGGEVVGQTPLVYRPPLPGLLTVSIEKEGYVRQDTAVALEPGAEPVRLSFVLDPQEGLLQEEGEYVNDLPQPINSEPDAPPPGTGLEARPDVPPRSAERPTDAVAETATPPPARNGHLLIDSDPQGASVLHRGREIGETPLFLDAVEPGSYTYTIRKDGHKPHEMQVEIEPNEVTALRAELSPLRGKLSVLVRPWGSVYVNDRMVARETDIEYHMDLPVGLHTVRVMHPALGSRTQRVRITEDQVQRVVVDFNQ